MQVDSEFPSLEKRGQGDLSGGAGEAHDFFHILRVGVSALRSFADHATMRPHRAPLERARKSETACIRYNQANTPPDYYRDADRGNQIIWGGLIIAV